MTLEVPRLVICFLIGLTTKQKLKSSLGSPSRKLLKTLMALIHTSWSKSSLRTLTQLTTNGVKCR